MFFVFLKLQKTNLWPITWSLLLCVVFYQIRAFLALWYRQPSADLLSKVKKSTCQCELTVQKYICILEAWTVAFDYLVCCEWPDCFNSPLTCRRNDVCSLILRGRCSSVSILNLVIVSLPGGSMWRTYQTMSRSVPTGCTSSTRRR